MAPVGASRSDQHDSGVFEVGDDRIENVQTLEIDPLHPVDRQHETLADRIVNEQVGKRTRQRRPA